MAEENAPQPQGTQISIEEIYAFLSERGRVEFDNAVLRAKTARYEQILNSLAQQQGLQAPVVEAPVVADGADDEVPASGV